MLAKSLRKLKSTLQTALNANDRRAKIQDGDFIVALLHATAVGTDSFSLAMLRLSVCSFLGIVVGQSAFNERMGTESLLRQVQLTLGVLMKEASMVRSSRQAAGLADRLGVESIVGVDGSLVSLWDGLSETFKGTFMEAAIKLHLAIDLIDGAVSWFDLTSGATHDSQRFPILKAGWLYLTDLGYWSVAHFSQIAEAGGFFLSRLKANRNLTITGVIAGGFGKSIIGQKLSQFPVYRRRGKIVELLGELTGGEVTIAVRVIGFWDFKERQYRWYVTNLNAPCGAIAELYRLRWQIELSFKAMKSTFNFDRIPTLSAKATQTMCLLGICHYVLSTILRIEANSRDETMGSISLLRSATVLRATARDLYNLLKTGTRLTTRKLDRFNSMLLPLIRSYLDPNRATRQTTVGTLESCLG